MRSEIEDPSIQGLEDGRLTSLYFKKLNIADLSCAVFSIIGMVLSILAVKKERDFSIFIIFIFSKV